MASGQRSRSQITLRSQNGGQPPLNSSTTPKPNGKRAVRSAETQRQKQSTDLRNLNGSHVDPSQGQNSDVSDDDADEMQTVKKQRKSAVYEYAQKISDWEYQCQLCKKTIRCAKGTNANIRRHLGNTHRLVHLKSSTHTSNTGVKFDPTRKKQYDEAAINCIIRDGRPFCEFRRPGMACFLNIIAPGYKGPHERTVRRTVKKLYISKLAELKKKLCNVDYVAMTTDLWKRPNKHYYLCVTGHFLDEDYENISTVLSFRRFHGRHLAVRIRNHLVRVINWFDLQSKIVVTITDNGSDVKAATQLKKKFGIRLHCLAHGLNLTLQNGLGLWQKPKPKENSTAASSGHDISASPDCGGEDEYDEDSEHDDEFEEVLPIPNHNLNNGDAASSESDSDNSETDELPRDDTEVVSSDEDTDSACSQEIAATISFDVQNVREILERCRKTVNTINKSNILYEAFQKLAPTVSQPNLVVDMRVRWGSTHTMIQRLIVHRSKLDELISKLSSLPGVTSRQRQTLTYSCLSENEWHILNVLCRCLELFAEASDMLSGSSYPSLGLVYPVLDSLHFYLNTPSDDDVESSIKLALLPIFKKYMHYKNDSPEHNLLLISSFLNPLVHDLMSDGDKVAAKNLIIQEWNKSSKVTANSVDVTSSPVNSSAKSSPSVNKTTNSASTVMQRLKNFRQKCGVTDQIPDQSSATKNTLTVKQELSQLEAFDKRDHTFSSFWQKHSPSLPILKQMAKHFGCIPATSVPSESAFSVAGYVARKTRSSLSGKNMKYTMFLKDKC